MKDKIIALISFEMFKRLHVLKLGAALVTYLGAQLILIYFEKVEKVK